MDTAALFVTAFLVALSGAMMPGPLLTVTITESARRGFRTGPQLVLGHALLELVLIIALMSGISRYLHNPIVTSVIFAVGGVFLLFIGINMVKDVIRGRIALENSETAAGKGIHMHPVIAGALISISSPYWVIWWATVGLTYLTMAIKNSMTGVASFFAGHILADLLWYSMVAAVIAGGRRFMSQRIFKIIIVLCGLFLAILGGYFISTLL